MFFLYDGRLNELDHQIACEIEKNPQFVISHNIYQTAEHIGISPSKLTKYCQKIKLSGYKELKYKIQSSIDQQKYLRQMDTMQDFTLITKIIENSTINNLYSLPALIDKCNKIILICDQSDLGLGNYFTYKLRKSLNKDISVYPYTANYQHEYITENVLSIIIDTSQTITKEYLYSNRVGDNYVHYCSTPLNSHINYYPIKFIEGDIPFDAKLCLIISWISNYKLFL